MAGNAAPLRRGNLNPHGSRCVRRRAGGQTQFRGLRHDYQQLREDPERWEQYLAERQEWDTLA